MTTSPLPSSILNGIQAKLVGVDLIRLIMRKRPLSLAVSFTVASVTYSKD